MCSHLIGWLEGKGAPASNWQNLKNLQILMPQSLYATCVTGVHTWFIISGYVNVFVFFTQQFDLWKSYLQPSSFDLWFSFPVMMQFFRLCLLSNHPCSVFVGSVSVLLAGMETPVRSSLTSWATSTTSPPISRPTWKPTRRRPSFTGGLWRASSRWLVSLKL